MFDNNLVDSFIKSERSKPWARFAPIIAGSLARVASDAYAVLEPEQLFAVSVPLESDPCLIYRPRVESRWVSKVAKGDVVILDIVVDQLNRAYGTRARLVGFDVSFLSKGSLPVLVHERLSEAYEGWSSRLRPKDSGRVIPYDSFAGRMRGR